jgi:hypothetical protein
MTVRYAVFAIQLAAVLSTVPGDETMRAEVADWTPTAGVNSPVFAVREPLPGQLGYLQAVRFIDDRMKYLEPLSAFFVSPAGELCFRTFPNGIHIIYDGYYSDWCLYPQAVSSVQAITMQIGNPSELVIWCGHSYPQCVRRYGYPVFPGPICSVTDSVTVPTSAYLDQRAILLNLIYLMGGNAVPDIPIPLTAWSAPLTVVEER